MKYFNKKVSLRVSFAGALIVLSTFASSAPINNLVIFGDSLSDTGNTRSEVPFGNAQPVATAVGYGSNGRFSNGPLWHEYLATSLGIATATNSNDGGNNFAFGGARIDDDDGFSTGVLRQNTQYLERQADTPVDQDSLFINWSGGNDMRDLVGNADPIAVIDQQLDALFGTLTGLLDIGVTQLLIPNLPDLGVIPENRGSDDQASATAVTQAWNSNLLARLFDLNNSTTADIYFFDVFSLFGNVLADPATYGITNTTEECRSVSFSVIENECDNPGTFAFWDAIHPTTAAHAILGEEAFRLISSGSVLQKDIVSASAPAMLVIFGMGIFGLFYRKSNT